jgi:hypothetical protein
LYCVNWKEHRSARGRWSEADEERARRFTLPSGGARKIFDSDPNIQRMLASQDARLPVYRDALETILARRSRNGQVPQFETVLRDFLDFCQHDNPNAYMWRASFGGVKCVFPGRDTWALWMCLRDMWSPYTHKAN